MVVWVMVQNDEQKYGSYLPKADIPIYEWFLKWISREITISWYKHMYEITNTMI